MKKKKKKKKKTTRKKEENIRAAVGGAVGGRPSASHHILVRTCNVMYILSLLPCPRSRAVKSDERTNEAASSEAAKQQQQQSSSSSPPSATHFFPASTFHYRYFTYLVFQHEIFSARYRCCSGSSSGCDNTNLFSRRFRRERNSRLQFSSPTHASVSFFV